MRSPTLVAPEAVKAIRARRRLAESIRVSAIYRVAGWNPATGKFNDENVAVAVLTKAGLLPELTAASSLLDASAQPLVAAKA